jgi:ribulose-phosphate 3-epimerase
LKTHSDPVSGKPSANRIRIAPSILSADFAALGSAIAAVEEGGADLIHVDVMDGHFVPNITIGPPVVKSLKRVARVPLDVHLMISDPDRYIEPFVEAGADMLSVHVEVLTHLHRTVTFIKSLGVKAGVVLNPSTAVSALDEIAGDVDFVLVMSVNPGFGGQKFIPRSVHKVSAIRAMLDRAGSKAPIEIDGGIDLSNVARVVDAGVEIVVAGSAIFGGADPAAATRALRDAAAAVAS